MTARRFSPRFISVMFGVILALGGLPPAAALGSVNPALSLPQGQAQAAIPDSGVLPTTVSVSSPAGRDRQDDAATRLADDQQPESLARLETALTAEARQAADQATPATPSAEETPVLADDLASSPVMFIENAGQWDDGARFQVWGVPAGTMWLAEDAIWITVLEQGQEEISRQVDKALDHRLKWPFEDREALAPRRGVNIKFSFVGANPQPRIETYDRLDTAVSYFNGPLRDMPLRQACS